MVNLYKKARNCKYEIHVNSCFESWREVSVGREIHRAIVGITKLMLMFYIFNELSDA